MDPHHQFNYHYRGEYEKHYAAKMPKHSDGDIRVILANFILNFEIPRDLYMVAAFLLSVYLTIRLFRFSIRLILSLVRPLIFIGIFLMLLPYLYDLKSVFSPSYTRSNNGYFQYMSEYLSSAYKHVTSFYARNWLNHK